LASRSSRCGIEGRRKFYKDAVAELTEQLVAHCEYHFKLDRPRKDGSTLRNHLQSAQRQSGRDLFADEPRCPAAFRHLTQWFNELHCARGSSGFGPNPIQYVDIAAWAALTGREPSPEEVAAIVRIDRAFLNVVASAQDGD
jgi:hypothetical protein